MIGKVKHTTAYIVEYYKGKRIISTKTYNVECFGEIEIEAVNYGRIIGASKARICNSTMTKCIRVKYMYNNNEYKYNK